MHIAMAILVTMSLKDIPLGMCLPPRSPDRHGDRTRLCLTVNSYSTFAPDRFTTSAHLTRSFFTNAANSSGVPPTGSASMNA